MGIFNFLLSLFLLLIFPFISAANTTSCPTSTCSSSNFTIRFPFQADPKASPDCVYPGFDLRCDDEGNTVIKLPNSGDFFVRSIDYKTQEIQLYDPSNCLPSRLLELNLSGTPFHVSYLVNYTFLLCPADFTQSRFTVVDCLSNSNNTTVATASNSLAQWLESTCKFLVSMPIPISQEMQYATGFTSALNGDLQLYWNVPDCEHCEAQGSVCGFQNNASQQVMCFDPPRTGVVDHHRLLKVIILTLAIATIICTFCTACICLVYRWRRHRTAWQQNFDPSTASLQPPNASISGLDQSAIELYAKVVIGESRRLPMGPNDGTCSICLSEYHAGEVLRCIPECQHCFHTGCIDEWLRLNNSCPVCRNSPSPAPDDSQPV